jgi:hypothetical protein
VKFGNNPCGPACPLCYEVEVGGLGPLERDFLVHFFSGASDAQVVLVPLHNASSCACTYIEVLRVLLFACADALLLVHIMVQQYIYTYCIA